MSAREINTGRERKKKNGGGRGGGGIGIRIGGEISPLLSYLTEKDVLSV